MLVTGSESPTSTALALGMARCLLAPGGGLTNRPCPERAHPKTLKYLAGAKNVPGAKQNGEQQCVPPLGGQKHGRGGGGITQGVLHLLGGLAHTNPFAIGPERHPQ